MRPRGIGARKESRIDAQGGGGIDLEATCFTGSKKNENGWGEELRALEATEFLKKDAFDLKGFEAAVRLAVMREGRRFLERFTNEILPAMLGLERVAGSKGKRSRQIGTSLGEIRISRAYVPGKGCPLDEALGLVEGFTPEAASMLCVAGCMCGSYDKGEAALRKLSGLEVPGRTIQRLVNAVSPQMEATGADRAQAPFGDGTAVINTQMDMTGVPMRPEDLEKTKGKDGDPRKKQIKAGVSFRQVIGSDGRLQVEKSSISHIVAFESPDEFGDRAYEWQTRRGLRDGTTHVVTSDGASWIWDQVDRVFPEAVQIVDFYHACEHLMELCRLLHPGKDETESKKLFKTRRGMLKAHGATSLIRYFEENGAKTRNSAQIEAKLAYFRTNEKRMRYDIFRKEGYIIGSGAVEGSCKSVINQRADLAGQRWHPDGALNVLRIRSMILDGIHEKYWKDRGMICLKKVS